MALSGQITVTTAGTAVQGPTTPDADQFAIKAHPDNTDVIWIGNSSEDVSSINGFPLNAGEGLVVSGPTLDKFWFDADVNGEKVCWIIL